VGAHGIGRNNSRQQQNVFASQFSWYWFHYCFVIFTDRIYCTWINRYPLPSSNTMKTIRSDTSCKEHITTTTIGQSDPPLTFRLQVKPLPVELWSHIIHYFVLQELGHPQWRCHNIPTILQIRLINRTSTPLPHHPHLLTNLPHPGIFNAELQRHLPRHITLPQLPCLPFMRVTCSVPRGTLIHHHAHTFYTSLLAAALYNPLSRARSRHTATSRSRPHGHIVHRIQNCVIIAQHISGPTSYDLFRHFCKKASTSRYCLRYMYLHRYSHDIEHTGVSGEANAYVEIALLVACGYGFEAVRRVIVELIEGKGLVWAGWNAERMVRSCKGVRDEW
jgi:hypothetical protein